MRENRTCGSEGGEAQSLPYPYPGQRSQIQSVVIIYRMRKSKTNPNLSPKTP